MRHDAQEVLPLEVTESDVLPVALAAAREVEREDRHAEGEEHRELRQHLDACGGVPVHVYDHRYALDGALDRLPVGALQVQAPLRLEGEVGAGESLPEEGEGGRAEVFHAVLRTRRAEGCSCFSRNNTAMISQ